MQGEGWTRFPSSCFHGDIAQSQTHLGTALYLDWLGAVPKPWLEAILKMKEFGACSPNLLSLEDAFLGLAGRVR